MKIGLIVLAGGVLLFGGIWLFGASGSDSCPLSAKVITGEEPTNDNTPRQPVLVELFTSEGCSSCPPADRELTFLQQNQPVAGAEIVTLAFHVDYWDRLGWKDAFSSAEYSERQNDYTSAKNLASNYTPQMIVDGAKEFVGSDARKANEAISNAVKGQKGIVEISADGKTADLKIDKIPVHDAATIYLAIAEDGLVTKVGSGENGGRTLSHTSVVRKLLTAGKLAAGEADFSGNAVLSLDSNWKPENLKFIAFVQEDVSKKIIAVGQKRYSTR